MMLTRLENELFFTFELNKRFIQKNIKFVLNLDGQKFLGILGILEEERFIPHSPGMKKAYSPFPHSPRNRNSDSSFSPFLEEENFMRNWELQPYKTTKLMGSLGFRLSFFLPFHLRIIGVRNRLLFRKIFKSKELSILTTEHFAL